VKSYPRVLWREGRRASPSRAVINAWGGEVRGRSLQRSETVSSLTADKRGKKRGYYDSVSCVSRDAEDDTTGGKGERERVFLKKAREKKRQESPLTHHLLREKRRKDPILKGGKGPVKRNGGGIKRSSQIHMKVFSL